MTTIAKISATDLQRKSGEVLRRVAVEQAHITVERDGYPVAVVIPITDYQRLMPQEPQS